MKHMLTRGVMMGALTAVPCWAFAQTVTMIDLGVSSAPGSFFSTGQALNNVGQVVGNSGPSTPGDVFLWQGGTMSGVPGLSGNAPLGINDGGVVAGTRGITAAVVDNGQVTVLGTLGGGASKAVAINNAGQVVGTSAYVAGTVWPTHAFMWQQGTMTDIGNFAPTAINASAVVAGTRDTGSGGQAVTWQGGALTDLARLPGSTSSAAQAINARGQVVGTSSALAYGTYGQQLNRATLWTDGQAVDLIANPFTFSQAKGINDAGDVVGSMADMLYYPVFTPERAFLWRQGTVYDLDALVSASAPGWHVSDAIAINDQGQILALGKFGSDWPHALLLTVGSVPEPGTWATLAMGLAAMSILVRGRRRASAAQGCLHDQPAAAPLSI